MFNGFLVTIHGTTDYNIPLEYMTEKSYKCTISTLDLDATRDANGVLHRNAVLQVPHCSFDTRPLTNVDVGTLWSNIQSRYIGDSNNEKKLLASVYLPESDSYYTGAFYIPDTEMTINLIKGGKVYYEPITFEFIGYGESQ